MVYTARDMQQFFTPSLVELPLCVTAFTFLRHGEMKRNPLNYPEIQCQLTLSDAQSCGEIASKLTAALSIHIDSFLGLVTKETQDGADTIMIIARFSAMISLDALDAEIKLKAADIIDTLMTLSQAAAE
jgi:hypothetical protein